jgi:hypothetical protein
LAAGFVERSLPIHAEEGTIQEMHRKADAMRLASASPAAKIPARKLSNLFFLDA